MWQDQYFALIAALGAAKNGPIAVHASIASGSVKGHELPLGVRELLCAQLADELLVPAARASRTQ